MSTIIRKGEREYILHLANGGVVSFWEKEEDSVRNRFIDWYYNAQMEDVRRICIGTFRDLIYIPKQSIAYVEVGEYVERYYDEFGREIDEPS